MRWLIAIVLPLTGCLLSEDNERVARLTEFNLMTRVADTATITFEHFGDNLDSPDCLILPEDVSASLGGSPFDVVTRGGYNTQTPGCDYPKLELTDLPTADKATIVIRDPSGTGNRTCDLGDALERVTLSVPGALPAGQSTAVQVTNLPADTGQLIAYLVSPTGYKQEVGRATEGSSVLVAVPSHYRGDYELRVLAQHKTTGPISYSGPCGVLVTYHQGRQAIVVTGP